MHIKKNSDVEENTVWCLTAAFCWDTCEKHLWKILLFSNFAYLCARRTLKSLTVLYCRKSIDTQKIKFCTKNRIKLVIKNADDKPWSGYLTLSANENVEKRENWCWRIIQLQ